MMIKQQYRPPSSQTHFLITGGGKGITAANAIALAKSFQSRFTLIGRSSLIDQEPKWSDGITDEPGLKAAALAYFQNSGQRISPREVEREVKRVRSSREISDTLKRIEEAGGYAEYLPADITDLDQLKTLLGDRIQDIDGLIHGAGALADKYIQDKSETDFDLVYGVKIGGIKNIFKIIPPGQLKYLVLFSSVAGFYGNAGQADYSTANEVLNKLAHHIKLTQPECQVVSIGWGPWDGGMVTPQLKRIFEKRNIPLISPETGAAALVDLLSAPLENPQVVIGDPLPAPARKMDTDLRSYTITREINPDANPFLADHVIGGNAVLPTVCAVAWFIHSCASLYPGFEFFAVRDYRVFQGIVFEEPGPQTYRLDLGEKVKDADKILFECKISSKRQNGKTRPHYQAEIELRRTIPEQPRFAGADLSNRLALPGKDLYDSNVLFHGPDFQGVERVLNISPEGLTTACRLRPASPEQMGQFQDTFFDPILADVHLQSMLIWIHHQKQTTGLPLRIRESMQYKKPSAGETSYATMLVKTITAHKLVADVISHDKDGYVYSEFRDAEITLNEKLLLLFQQNRAHQESS